MRPATLARGIGLFDATALVVGSMIGSGIFIVSAESSRVLGSSGWLLAAWGIAGLLTMVAALSCSELAAMLPKAGGQYVFFREAYGPLVGFLFGWALFLVIQSGTIAAVSVAFAKFLGVLWPAISAETPLFTLGPIRVSPAQAVALAVIGLLTATNATGLRAGTRTQNVFTTAKLAALLALTGLGLFLGSPGAALRSPGFWSAFSPSGQALSGAALVAALGTAMVGPLFSQSAWNNVTFAGEEIREPERTLPLALLVGCLIVTAVYVLANVAYENVLSLAAIQHAPADRVGTAAAMAMFGPGAAAATAAAIMVSTFGCVNGLILSGARVTFAMARDGLFFRRLAIVNRASVPASALVAQGIWSGVLVLSGDYGRLLKYVISVDILFYVMLVLAVIVLRRRRPEWPRPFRAPGYPALPLLYAAAGMLLIVILLAGNPATTWPGYAIVASGIPVYFLWRLKR
ncbi:MAG: amino acid permease [Acidobacteria bacterium]|nr:amino acid permease [Acidobacteriota bacterium]MCA1609624.1 amino acid permease [Acidobacteriota bacterium]